MDEDPVTGIDTDDVYRPHQRIRAYQSIKVGTVAVLVAALLFLNGTVRVVAAVACLFFFGLTVLATGGATLDLEREEAARRRNRGLAA